MDLSNIIDRFRGPLIGYAALPMLSVLLMVGATLLALFRIRRAQISPGSDLPDATEQQSAILLKWWKSFGLIPVCLSFVALVVFLLGYTFPVFLFFLGSGIAMVALVTRLGRAGLIDRKTVGGTLISSLVGLAQVTQITSMVDSGFHLLDQELVMMILMLAAMLLGLVLTIGNWNGWQSVAKSIGLTLFAIVVFGFFGVSLWNPMNTQKMKNYVEGFDRARFSSASWETWAVPAIWLQQSGVAMDLLKPRAVLHAEFEDKQNPFILGVASRTGLVVPDDLSRVRDPFNRRRQLLDPYSRDEAILSIGQLEFAIRELVMLGQSKEGELDRLESRLLATIKRSVAPESVRLDEALVATKLLVDIGRPCMDGSIREQMQEQLFAMQRTRFNLGGRNGGFAAHSTLQHSDLRSTSSAVELMEHYGVPSDLNIMALRSFLRPAMSECWMIDQAAMRAATRMRLEGLAEVPPLTWWDYVRHEPSIAMAIVFSLLCFFATLGCPNRSPNNAYPLRWGER